MRDKIVHFKVIKHSPVGIKVRLDDGREGIIREREISWSPEERGNWRERYPVGWKATAMILAEDQGGRLELSLRLVDNNPWEDIRNRFKEGQIVKGVVKGVESYGAFVEIATGVTGLIHKSRVPRISNRNFFELFWPRDHVLVKIILIDENERRVDLGLAPKALPSLIDGEENGVELNSLFKNEIVSKKAESPLEKISEKDIPKKHILVIEDDQDQAAAICSWLENVGQRVDHRIKGGDGLDLIEKDPPDFVFIDIGLPDVSGIDVVREIQEKWPKVKCMITTDWARADEHVLELEELEKKGAGFILKPILLEDVLEVLLEKHNKNEDENLVNNLKETVLRNGFAAHTMRERSFTDVIKEILKNCRQRVNFQAVMLFELDPAKRTVSLFDKYGSGILNPNAINSLIYSPVRDVAEDEILEIVEDIDVQHKGTL